MCTNEQLERFHKGVSVARRWHNAAVDPPPQIVQHQRLSGKPRSLFCPAFFTNTHLRSLSESMHIVGNKSSIKMLKLTVGPDLVVIDQIKGEPMFVFL